MKRQKVLRILSSSLEDSDIAIFVGKSLCKEAYKYSPYSHGSFPGSGQYGLLEISDDGGSTVTAELSGWDWDGNELVRLVYSVDADPDVS